MGTELRQVEHYLTGERAIEVWWHGELVATVYAMPDVPGVTVITTHPAQTLKRRSFDGVRSIAVQVYP